MIRTLPLALVLLFGCGEPEPRSPADDGAGGSEAPATDSPPEPEHCYVQSVDGQTGCWAEAADACDEVCGAPCLCTEAIVDNTCGC